MSGDCRSAASQPAKPAPALLSAANASPCPRPRRMEYPRAQVRAAGEAKEVDTVAEGNVPIRYSDPSQETDAAQNLAADVAKILTPNEEILYIAMQNEMALSLKKDCVVATTNRLILYRPQILGRASFDDFQWQDVQNARIAQGSLSSAFSVEAADGRQASLGELDKEQAKRLYSVCQQMEQEWREKRRVRDMEEARARSGGIYMSPAPGDAAASRGEDPVAKLAKAKTMLDQGFISEAEYDALKAKILSSL